MHKPVGVIATVGPDPGLTEEERRERARRARWAQVSQAAQNRLGRIEERLRTETNASVRASLEIKAEVQRGELRRAEMELASADDPPN